MVEYFEATGRNKCSSVGGHPMNTLAQAGRPPASRGDVYLSSAQLRERYGNISPMTVWRWVRDEKMSFPAPLLIGKRNFWRLSDLETFERSRKAA